MNLTDLNQRFAIPGVLAFDRTSSGLILAQATAPAAEAAIYLQGAHLAHWQPAGHRPVLFVSSRADLEPGKPIRGGVPVIFPWFGPRADDPMPGGKPSPAHGFARTAEWDLAFAALSGEDLHLTFTLAPNPASRALGFDRFRVAYRLTIGRALSLELLVANDAAEPLRFEEALHTYFAVSNVENVSLTGLAGIPYLDKRDEMRRKVEPQLPMHLTETTDRVYLHTASTCVIGDPGALRRIAIAKSGSHTTVVWNPWAEVARTLPDMEPGGWRTMLCVETANVGQDAIILAPGATHTMRADISLEESA